MCKLSRLNDDSWLIEASSETYLIKEPEMDVYCLRTDYSGPESLADSFWYGIVTLSTVGYGDKFPVTTGGKITGFFLIVFTFTFLGALIGMVSDAVMEARRREELGMDGTKFKDHIVICGWTNIGRVSLQELLATEQQVVVITNDQDDIPVIQDLGTKKQVYTVFGEYSNAVILERANIEEARTVIVATGEDTKNLITALTIKGRNPAVRIIVSIREEELKQTLYSAGVTYVSSPAEMTGRLVASAAFEPQVARFVEDITSATAGFDLLQYPVTEGFFALGLTVAQFRDKMDPIDGPLLVSLVKYRPKTGVDRDSPQSWEQIPNPDEKLKIDLGDIIIVLGNDDQNEKLRELIDSASPI